MSADFLVELGTEELPPKALKNLMTSFVESIEANLKAEELSFTSIKPFAAPRRLAVLVEGLASETPSKSLTVWGPPAAIAFDKEGQPTKAAIAFAEKNGIAASELKTESDGKAEKLVARINTQGKKTVELLEGVVSDALAKLPIAKRMKWGAKREEFVRPVHWLVMLFGSDVINANVLGLQAGRTSRGHRFHYNNEISLKSAADYESELKHTGHVWADFNLRKQEIVRQVKSEAEKINGIAAIDEDLLDEVTALVEWPVALTGKFEERFLAVPAEALIASMKEHQKYFHVVDVNGKLKNNFITVANIQSKDAAQIIAGNERVIRPRLSDAAFFFETDKKTTLESLRERLKTIVFQAQLGTIHDKTERVAKLASHIAKLLNADEVSAVRAAQLCKSDLVTNMVGEFDDMQGIAGYYYAQNDGENAEVAAAMNEQYMPRFAGDQLPSTITGTIIALADRLDTISGIFGIGQQPTGSKDPFALRRASIAVLRLLVEKNLALDLRELLTFAKAQHSNLSVGDELVEQVLSYMLDRFRAMFEDAQIPAEVFQSVNAKQLSQPLDINQRVLAVNEFSKLPQAQALAAANKRVSNILSKQNASANAVVHADLLREDAEKNLAHAISGKAELVTPLFDKREYTKALAALADLQQPVDAFFDSVMVMCDDAALQQNRLALLQQLRALFLEVADISYLVPAKN
ncbi:glycine--tRNA ligase beta subunit [Cellvibrio zantedeschiae]|uniref:Glycine--tRNA ligase beta subunit n=1 Tax=Cellvibrio zantedeschiae TaxID=1237077 RepID=A0ABQ3BAI0_9GAMM|nr:glycine--tRNA ligase subunit beta [Cellvibrio zantedeschiae]GGY88216.1 glycine--tRNA ligase beta subunit [Cellvibrio zantedeschiae]